MGTTPTNFNPLSSHDGSITILATNFIVIIVTPPLLLYPVLLLCLDLSAFNLVPIVQSAPVPDLIDSLPGYGKLPTRQYSGFLSATDGCDVDVNGICMLHYWFVEAEGDKADEKPVLLWLNGGPGTLSVMGES